MTSTPPAITIPDELRPRDGRFGSGPSKVRQGQVDALLAAGDPERYASAAAALALVVGAVCLFGRVLRLGFLADLLSRPVLVGYLAGIAVLAAVGVVIARNVDVGQTVAASFQATAVKMLVRKTVKAAVRKAERIATLEAAGIEAAIVSTSPIKIACHVPSTDVDRAVQALHEAFELG